jgi:selenocysteine-specific translation elongation factor
MPDIPYNKIQFTLVDCPGHASLIRTIIGGSQIIDMFFLVIDINKGIQTQTAEVHFPSSIPNFPGIGNWPNHL